MISHNPRIVNFTHAVIWNTFIPYILGHFQSLFFKYII